MICSPDVHARMKSLGQRPSQLPEPTTCAYCGTTDHMDWLVSGRTGEWHIECRQCGQVEGDHVLLTEVIERWNRAQRATAARLQQRRDAIGV
jgi:transcription elongation factor Elf1